MAYNISRPSPPLSRFIKHYWTMENIMPDGMEHIQRIVPSGLPELIFYLGDRPVATDINRSIDEPTLLAGQTDGFYDLIVTGKLSLFSIIFQPHCLSAFLDMPVGELYNQNVPLRLIFKDETSMLETRLSESNTLAEKTVIVEECFLRLLKQKRSWHSFQRISRSIDLINHSKGLVRIDKLASEACLSRKQFGRVFSDTVGTTPGKFLKIVRFQSAVDRKSRNRHTTLADLTYDCGYYDQAHMINDFQKLSGMTPKNYFEECEPLSDYFS
jgi:AraC-like DNA-binding protein